MPIPMLAGAVLDRYFLEMRSKVLDVAAALDRIERAAEPQRSAADARMAKLRQAVEILLDARPDRAARVLAIFSDPYDPKWPRPAKRV
jgi:hypothetical protein